MPFGSIFKDSREQAGLSQAAWRLDLKPAELKRIEEGTPITKFELWERIRDLYGFPSGPSL
jgi:ribosome-binding protein aMBF1 (putative translation factor)